MIDIRYIRENQAEAVARYAAKGHDLAAPIADILRLDEQRIAAASRVDTMRAERNAKSKLVPQLKAKGEDATALLAEMKALADQIKVEEDKSGEVEEQLTALLVALPNLPDPDLAPGGKEANETLYSYGEPTSFSFTPKDHVELCTSLGLIDYDRGTKLAGSGFVVYSGMGARLELALLNYFIDFHLQNGYELTLVPHLLSYECGFASGQFPKFEDDVFWVSRKEEDTSGHRRFLLPTSETALVSLHRDEILDATDLPRKYVSYTPCFRVEAGNYRAEERGTMRGHQFNKVELVQYTAPEQSDEAFAQLVNSAETLVKNLGLHFRTVKLAAGDCSDAMARTYDIEIFIPSMGGYKEVSSVSNSRDYQARRGMTRFRREPGAKPEYVHTLNASGLATSRIFPALVEQYQQADGSIAVPQVLQKYLGLERLGG
ncbi:MAG: serine--tRNA ligase [Oscillospiraceae bacterium]|nr:serine--tRNA ligase [Oscillospiraceae bacterium]